MTLSLEKLNQNLFKPLAASESASLYGGAAAAAKFTFMGLTELGGQVYNDYSVD